MRRIAVQLGALMRSQGVFDGQLVRAELTGERVELLLGRGAQVHPTAATSRTRSVGGDPVDYALWPTPSRRKVAWWFRLCATPHRTSTHGPTTKS